MLKPGHARLRDSETKTKLVEINTKLNRREACNQTVFDDDQLFVNLNSRPRCPDLKKIAFYFYRNLNFFKGITWPIWSSWIRLSESSSSFSWVSSRAHSASEQVSFLYLAFDWFLRSFILDVCQRMTSRRTQWSATSQLPMPTRTCKL